MNRVQSYKGYTIEVRLLEEEPENVEAVILKLTPNGLKRVASTGPYVRSDLAIHYAKCVIDSLVQAGIDADAKRTTARVREGLMKKRR
jgi:hypothetical protein